MHRLSSSPTLRGFTGLATVAVLLALLFPLLVDRVWSASAAGAETRVLVPLIRSSGPDDITVFPPKGLLCFLQTGVSSRVDPASGRIVYTCEAQDGHGQIGWYQTSGSQGVLLFDHFTPGSASLDVVDGGLWLTAVNDDGSVRRARIAMPQP